jgi:acetylornithine/succinyldiaminopimelate/putrescine aminotransferase
MPASIAASTVCEPAAVQSPVLASAILATCERMIREQLPNLLRLYVNPHVAQACYCLTHVVAEVWPGFAEADDYQVFLANSGEEALSGAIKLARYAANAEGAAGAGLLLDPDHRFEHFASTELAGHGRLEFIPGIEIAESADAAADRLDAAIWPIGFVIVPHELLEKPDAPLSRQLDADPSTQRPLLIVYATQEALDQRVEKGDWLRATHQAPAKSRAARCLSPFSTAPDIVVFDESFVNREVPFGAFAATKRLFQHWNRKGMTTFHSTTYQPNTISSLHLVTSLRAAAPAFMARHAEAMERIECDSRYRYDIFRKFYSRSLAKLATAVGVRDAEVRASGHYVSVSGKRIFDGVAGVACSLRGHNPRRYVEEIQETGELDCVREELADRLEALTGLPKFVPAVSGASAVEHALKLGLASQFPRDWVLALRGGFGGKTLFALTGTWQSTLKTGLAPLYPNVVYVDPFSENAVAEVERAFREHTIGVVQLELVQGVGGVRAVPDAVLQSLVQRRRETGCLLFVDEVQTGMFRTGPFARSKQLGIQPDLLTVGKGTSDMMFPLALTLYSEAVEERLHERECLLPDAIRARYGYETGLRTLLSTLRRAEEECLPDRVRERSDLFARLLGAGLRDCPLVREVRCFGLLIGIELDTRGRSHRWLKKLVGQLYLLALLNHKTFPLLIGYCQYEPNVLKLTPPLSVTEDEIHQICATLSSVLHRPLSRVAISGLMRMSVLPRLKWPRPRFSQEARP